MVAMMVVGLVLQKVEWLATMWVAQKAGDLAHLRAVHWVASSVAQRVDLMAVYWVEQTVDVKDELKAGSMVSSMVETLAVVKDDGLAGMWAF